MRKSKVVSAAEAVDIIRDGDTVACSGFVGCGTPEELLIALEARFVDTEVLDLTLVFAAAPGDGKMGGLNRLAKDGLVKRAVGGHYGLVPKLAEMAVDGRIEGYNLPLGTISTLFRDIAGHRAGTLTKVGLGTFVDPRQGGGEANSRTHEDLVRLMNIDGEEWLYYKAMPITVALIQERRRTRTEHHDGTRAIDARQSCPGDGREKLRGICHCASRARLRPRGACPAAGSGSRSACRLCRRRAARESSADLPDDLQRGFFR